MKKIYLIMLLSMLGITGFAQQEIMVSQYMFNGLFLNPGYAGSHKYFSSSLLHRSQWVNFDGAPKTYLFAVDGPLMNESMGAGLIVANDKIGITTETDVFLNYSYHLKVSDNSKLGFGIKGGFSSYRADYSDLTYWDEGDEIYKQGSVNEFMPKFGFGLYYHADKYYAGISIPTLLAYAPEHKFSLDIAKSSQLRRHYFVNGGYIFDINDDVKLKPSFLLKFVPNAPLQADVNCSVMFWEALWLGLSYRTGDAVTAIVEYQANKRFRVGYSYDITTSSIRSYSNGSHEIMLGYDFGKDFIKIKTPRYF